MIPDHPITPPPELVEQWWDGTHGAFYEFEAVATQAARWGADQELEACCEWLADDHTPVLGQRLRSARRPQPPNLKEQALEALYQIESEFPAGSFGETIRRALEALPES